MERKEEGRKKVRRKERIATAVHLQLKEGDEHCPFPRPRQRPTTRV
jgi:hypothetical protein